MNYKSVLTSLICLSLSLLTQAATVLPMYLDEIVADAAVAFEGVCKDARTELDVQTGLVVTYTTFDIIDLLKGSAKATHTIKQLGGNTGTVAYKVGGTPSFVVGTRYVVFLYGASSAGFSSPVGLTQGRFMIRNGPAGDELSNGRDFKEMLRPYPDGLLPPGAKKAVQQATGELGHMDLAEFKQIVRQPGSATK